MLRCYVRDTQLLLIAQLFGDEAHEHRDIVGIVDDGEGTHPFF